ncbi:MAG: hypothetical protein NUV97_01305 [archaeon]|nr:hypothetical protein [archaeon]MCR4323400.1 hypothetical protein [Nanoarchaeota archaeon]
MVNAVLEALAEEAPSVMTAGEEAYLSSMMPEVRQEGYTCVSGCSNCVSCDGNDRYASKEK